MHVTGPSTTATGRNSRLMRRLHKNENAEINLVSMIDMMTILVFFLLVHGGFIRLAVLQLNLPSAQSEARAEPPAFQLEIIVREAAIEIGDRATGLLSRIEKTEAGYDFAALTERLSRLKEQFPEKDDATVLVEPEVPYDVAVAVMDRVRVAEQPDPELNRVNRIELFPQISIGDAPL
jgi:biopolymer transport protein ExbD